MAKGAPRLALASTMSSARIRMLQLAVVIITVSSCLLTLVKYSNSDRGGCLIGLTRTRMHSSGRACVPEFLEYLPSRWEEEWRSHKAWHGSVCSTQKKQDNLVREYLETVDSTLDGEMTLAMMKSLQNDLIWSRLKYQSCEGRVYEVPIEPLVGLFRHPYGEPSCQTEGWEAWTRQAQNHPSDFVWNSIQDLNYQLVLPLPPPLLKDIYPGRKYLFDIGTGRWSSGSVKWFTAVYGARNIEFDEIFGWEITKISPTEYWGEVPVTLHSKLHWYNIPAAIDAQSPNNPWNIIRRIFRPGDLVAVKLDIDNAPLETDLIDQLDEPLISKIQAFYYEKHYDVQEMRKYFGGGLSDNYTDAFEQLSGLRHLGLQLHAWP